MATTSDDRPTGEPPGGPRERPLLFERLRRTAMPLAVLLSAMLVVTLSFTGPRWLAGVVVLGTVAVVLWLRTSDSGEDDGYGPGTGS